MPCDERVQLADELVVPPQCEVRLEALLERRDPELFQARALHVCERLGAELRERRAAPERDPVAKRRGGLLGPSGRQRASPVGEQALEPVRIDGLRVEREPVAGARVSISDRGSTFRSCET